MADSSRSQKLAAARKKLKQFQKQSKSGEPQPTAKKKAVLKAVDEDQESCIRSEKFDESVPYTSASGINPATPIDDKSSELSSQGDRPISSTESIRQISMQLNGLMSQTHDFFNGEVELENPTISEVENRNLELAALLENHSQTNERLTNQIQDLKNQNSRLQSQTEQQLEEAEERHRKEQGSTKEQLQVHIQTIGILVAEKTELQSSLAQSQQSAKQKAAEIEELQGRLKASRGRVVDLEKEVSTVTLASQQFEKSSKAHSKDVDRLKLEAYKNSKILEEVQQQNSELTEKLTRTATECQNVQLELDEVKRKLSMTELYVQQLSGSTDGENNLMLEDLAQEKINLEKKLIQLGETVQTLSQERDTMAEQYQQFTKQLNQQVHNLGQQVTSLTEEKTTLLNEKSALSSKLITLEDQLEQQSQQSGKYTVDNTELEELKQALKILQEEKDQLLDQHRKQVSDNSQLSLLVSEHENKIQELEMSLESHQQEQVDKKQLLDEIQSDKVAASRAIAQNRQLKKQLEELQNGFIVMSNNKLELVEKLEGEQHVTKELGERLGQQEEELKELRHQLSGKEDDLNMLHKSSTELTKQMFQQQQLVDRVRHYEAQGQLTEMLHQELNQAQERINALTIQNNELRTTLAQQAHQLLQSNSDGSAANEDKESAKKDDLVASLSSSVHQLEMERDQLLLQLGQQQGQREAFRAQLKEMKESNLHQNGTNGETVSSEEYDNLKQVMHKLENRFTKTMSDIAELSDQKQQLEHLVLQLQGETETIGEYIALYQVQRGIMKQRALEKDEYISQLARDREELKTKLSELQDLVMRLLYERQQYQANLKAESVRPPGKAVASTPMPVDMSALNGVAALPDWPDLEEDFGTLDKPSLNNGAECAAPDSSRKQSDTTAKKIMDLITEIGSSSLVEKPVLDNFHPCPVCSGKLMTV